MLLALVAMIAIATTTAQAKKAATIKVGLVTDIAGLGDKSFNFLAGEGVKQAKKKYGITYDITVSKSGSSYAPMNTGG